MFTPMRRCGIVWKDYGARAGRPWQEMGNMRSRAARKVDDVVCQHV
jgi:hypothetical protein